MDRKDLKPFRSKDGTECLVDRDGYGWVDDGNGGAAPETKEGPDGTVYRVVRDQEAFLAACASGRLGNAPDGLPCGNITVEDRACLEVRARPGTYINEYGRLEGDADVYFLASGRCGIKTDLNDEKDAGFSAKREFIKPHGGIISPRLPGGEAHTMPAEKAVHMLNYVDRGRRELLADSRSGMIVSWPAVDEHYMQQVPVDVAFEPQGCLAKAGSYVGRVENLEQGKGHTLLALNQREIQECCVVLDYATEADKQRFGELPVIYLKDKLGGAVAARPWYDPSIDEGSLHMAKLLEPKREEFLHEILVTDKKGAMVHIDSYDVIDDPEKVAAMREQADRRAEEAPALKAREKEAQKAAQERYQAAKKEFLAAARAAGKGVLGFEQAIEGLERGDLFMDLDGSVKGSAKPAGSLMGQPWQEMLANGDRTAMQGIADRNFDPTRIPSRPKGEIDPERAAAAEKAYMQSLAAAYERDRQARGSQAAVPEKADGKHGPARHMPRHEVDPAKAAAAEKAFVDDAMRSYGAAQEGATWKDAVPGLKEKPQGVQLTPKMQELMGKSGVSGKENGPAPSIPMTPLMASLLGKPKANNEAGKDDKEKDAGGDFDATDD